MLLRIWNGLNLFDYSFYTCFQSHNDGNCIYHSFLYFLYCTKLYWEWNVGQVLFTLNCPDEACILLRVLRKLFIIKCLVRLMPLVLHWQSVEHVGSGRTILSTFSQLVLESRLHHWLGELEQVTQPLYTSVSSSKKEDLHHRFIVKIKCDVTCKTLIPKMLIILLVLLLLLISNSAVGSVIAVGVELW